MEEPKQLRLPLSLETNGKQPNSNNLYSGREIGTFKDSMRAPIFRWFRYPAGYSYKFVFESFDMFDVGSGDWVYDPFSGTGTTLICAKQKGVNGYGVEAHSFVHWVADVKLNWDFTEQDLNVELPKILHEIHRWVEANEDEPELEDFFPELVHKCFHPTDLKKLYLIREYISLYVIESHYKDLLKLALTDTLRGAAVAGTGWPYISPKGDPSTYEPKGALGVFSKTLMRMIEDLRKYVGDATKSIIQNQLGDSRNQQDIEDAQIKLALTSPPYLNNYDYADRTRLETYFWGITSTWREITEKFRDKLMVAATTQIRRSHYDVETALSEEIKASQPDAFEQIQSAVLELSKLRLQKGGRKDYDLMTALYFNDMFAVLTETYRVLSKSGRFCLVLGDSAPYGVHIPTDNLIGEIALGLGFSKYQYHELRVRGKKWKDNPQRHKVPLREGVVVLTK